MNKKYYLVDELDNDGNCFGSVKEIIEALEDTDLTLTQLNIYDTKMVLLNIDAESIIENAIEDSDIDPDYLSVEHIDEDELKELQTFLNKWCKKIDTNWYERSRRLSIDEVYERLELEKNDGINL